MPPTKSNTLGPRVIVTQLCMSSEASLGPGDLETTKAKSAVLYIGKQAQRGWHDT